MNIVNYVLKILPKKCPNNLIKLFQMIKDQL